MGRKKKTYVRSNISRPKSINIANTKSAYLSLNIPVTPRSSKHPLLSKHSDRSIIPEVANSIRLKMLTRLAVCGCYDSRKNTSINYNLRRKTRYETRGSLLKCVCTHTHTHFTWFIRIWKMSKMWYFFPSRRRTKVGGERKEGIEWFLWNNRWGHWLELLNEMKLESSFLQGGEKKNNCDRREK
jgi:hypothetical protein